MSVTMGVDRDAVYRKITWRLMPFILACYVINYLDRVSIGYAKLQFMPELHMNEAVFGMITSVFFFGYIAFEVLSNLLLMRIGAPATLTRVMVLWGSVVVSMMFARNEYWLYVQRFLLGSFEAGFFPGVLLYLSFCTLTTLGYGDIIPLRGVAQTACYLEAVVGQIFLTVLVARLVGMHISRPPAVPLPEEPGRE